MRRSSSRRFALLVVALSAACCAAWAAPASATTVTIDTPPAKSTNVTSGQIDFTVTTTPPGTPVATTCTLTGPSPIPQAGCTSPFGYNNLSEGTYTFTVDAADDGNGVGTASYTWRVDTTRPVTDLFSSPPDSTTATSATFKFRSSEAGTFTCTLDGVVSPCTSPQTYPGPLAVGPHSFSVFATDQAGNEDDAPATRDWTITAPIVGAPQIVTGALALSNNPNPAFTFSDADLSVVSFECQMDGGAWAPCVSGNAFPVGEGSHTFSVRGVNGTGDRSLPASQAFTVDLTPPKTTIGRGPPSVTSSADASFDLFSTEFGSTFTCQLDGGAPAPCTSPARFLGLPSGNHVLSVKATDAAGNTDPVGDTWSWTIKGAPHPSFSASNLNPLTGVPVTFTNTSTADPGYAITALAWDLDGDGLFDDGGGPSVARSFATPGNHTVRLSVRSEPGGGSGTAEVTVHVGDRPPVAGFRVSPRVPRARTDVDLVSAATDPDTPIAAQAWSVRERGVRMQADGGAATVRFPKAGTYHVTLRVTDSLGAVGSITKTLKVREQPVPPWLVDISGLPRVAGARFTKLRIRAPQGARVYVRCRGRHCRVRRAFRKTVGRSANLYVRPFQTFFWAGSVIEVQVSDPGYQTKYVRIRVRGGNRGVERLNGCVVPGGRPGRCRS